MQVHLPHDQSSRVTMGMSRIHNTTGLAVGYAYMMDDERNTALTIAVGHAGSETAVRGSFGFEFGGQRKAVTVTPTSTPTPTPTPTTSGPAVLMVEQAEYDELYAQAVQKEELESYIEEQEYRYAQQQNQLKANDAELARLKAEAEALRKEQEAAAARRAAINKRLTEKGSKDGN